MSLGEADSLWLPEIQSGHVFGAQETAPSGRVVRTIGTIRARAKIGLQNLVYNIRRLATLERMAAA